VIDSLSHSPSVRPSYSPSVAPNICSLDFAEIQLFSSGVQLADSILSASISSSLAGHGANYCIDGNFTTYCSTKNITSGIATITITSPTFFDSVSLVNSNNCGALCESRIQGSLIYFINCIIKHKLYLLTYTGANINFFKNRVSFYSANFTGAEKVVTNYTFNVPAADYPTVSTGPPITSFDVVFSYIGPLCMGLKGSESFPTSQFTSTASEVCFSDSYTYLDENAQLSYNLTLFLFEVYPGKTYINIINF
jgi:hypothetical protein